MVGALGYFQYISDDGNTYKVKTDASNAALTGGVGSTTDPMLPHGYYPRYILAESASGNRRKVPVMDPASDVWTGVASTIAQVEGGVAGTVSYGITARIGEKRTSR